MNEETPPQAALNIGKKPPLSLFDQLVLSNFWFALNFQSSALLPVVVAAQVLLFASNQDKVVLFGILSTGGTVAALLAQPLIGVLSDHTHLHYGRRRPYILLGTILSLIGMALLAQTESLLVFALAFLLVQIANNGSTAAYQSLIPDRVPPEQRGSAAGYMGLMTIFGSFASLAAAAYLFSDAAPGPNQAAEIQDDASAFYLLTGVILLVTTIITVIGIVEHGPEEGSLPRADTSALPVRRPPWRRRMVDLWIAPLRHYNFRWVFLTRLSLMMGLWLFQTFIEYYLDDVLHLTNFIEATGVLAGLALIGAVVSAVAAGWLSDKTGRVKIVYLASGLMALAASAFVVAPSAWLLWPMAVLFGLGYGAYLSVDWALAVDALPSLQEAGKDMGLWSIASNLPTVAAPVVGSIVITLVSNLLDDAALGYRLVFAVAALTLIAAAVFIVKVREERPARRPDGRRAAWGWRLAKGTGHGAARGFLRFWPLWERFTLWLWKVQPVPNAPHGLFQVSIHPYKGRSLVLPDGTSVASGDPIMELHLVNWRLEAAAGRQPLALLKEIRKDLAAIAQGFEERRYPPSVRALYGVTILAAATPRLGFTLRPRPLNLHGRLERFFLKGLLALYSADGLARLERGSARRDLRPQEVWMSVDTLLARYGAQPSR